MQPNHTNRIARYYGFTLVELMIAIAISTILMLGVIQVFIMSKHAYHLDNGLARAQENARFAVHTMSEDIRMAGYIGCRAANVANTLNNQSDWMYDFDTPLQGWDGSATGTYPYPTEFAANVVPGTDAIVVLRGGDTQYQITKVNGQGALASATFQLNTAVGLNQYDIVMVSDCNQASIFQITNDPTISAVNELDHTMSKSIVPGNCTQNLGSPIPATGCGATSGYNYAYNLNAGMLKMLATAYYIGKSKAGTGNSLYRLSMDKGAAGKPEELAEGVENMQILYGVDTTGDGLANQYITANKVQSTVANGFKAVVSVRLGLLVDTTTNVLKSANNVTYTIADSVIKPGTGGPIANQHPSDNKLRFPITATIKLRNRGVM